MPTPVLPGGDDFKGRFKAGAQATIVGVARGAVGACRHQRRAGMRHGAHKDAFGRYRVTRPCGFWLCGARAVSADGGAMCVRAATRVSGCTQARWGVARAGMARRGSVTDNFMRAHRRLCGAAPSGGRLQRWRFKGKRAAEGAPCIVCVEATMLCDGAAMGGGGRCLLQARRPCGGFKCDGRVAASSL